MYSSLLIISFILNLVRKKSLKIVLGINLLFFILGCILFLFIVFPNKQLLVDLRFALFSSKVSISEFKSSLPILKASYDFKIDPSVQVYKLLIDETEILKIAKTIKITGTSTRSYINLNDKIENINTNHGYCSDFSEVFLAMALKNGFKVREVHTYYHTINGFYNDSSQKWVFIDVNFGLLAKDKKGNNLSLEEMQQFYLDKDTIYFYDYFADSIVFNQFTSTNHNYNNPNSFKMIALTLGNNVYEVDNYSNKFSFLPKEFQQMINMFLGIQPKYAYYIDQTKYEDRYAQLLNKVYIVLVIMVITWLAINFLVYLKLKSI